MQNKAIKAKFILLSVPAELLDECGISEGSLLEMYAVGKKLVICQANDTDGFVCDGDCKNCPVSKTECDGDCERCPCNIRCDESEVF